jgi:hypothetical protein
MRFAFACVAAAALVAPAFGQTTADYRIRADFRTPSGTGWAADESVGNADFRVHSRFLAVYYGGVMRQDDFTMSVQISFDAISGFATNFPTSSYNSDYDVYFNNFYMGRAVMGQSTTGIAELTYKSRHPDAPERPVPANWPSPIEVGTTVRVFFASGAAPTFGDPIPATGSPIFTSTMQEKWARGDVNQDGHVNGTDFATFSAQFDPANLTGPPIGPTRGDFTGDNRSDAADYAIMAQNWDGSSAIPPLPTVCLDNPAAPTSRTACIGGSASFTTAGVGTGTFTYQWRKNGVNISNATNPTARSATLNIPSASLSSAGTYTCLVTNSCGSVASAAATLTVCAADYNCSGANTTQDIFDYLTSWFAAEPRADIDGVSGLAVGDIFDFLTAWFAGC